MTTPTEQLLPGDADPLWGPVLTSLTTCLCATLTAAGRPACACCLVWGASPPAHDWCDCDCDDGSGQAWVRLVRWDPIVDYGANSGGRCDNRRMRAVIEVGISRCVAVAGPDGQSAPECAQREADALSALADARLMREAICCDALSDLLVELDTMRPTGPQGGCAGVIMQITVEA
ncbi:hypothetical protein [Streptomyces xiamenensis]|uniref:hypothetical protein n=1 Tax=Streptomyces xiamenensis TaxID=408015 RepID=UPI003D74F76F